MTGRDLKRLILGAITLIVVALLGSSLLGSLSEPQITDRIQLYQTDLLLNAAELKSNGAEGQDWAAGRDAILGKAPLETALEQYQEVRRTAETNLQQLETRLQRTALPSDSIPETAGVATVGLAAAPTQALQTAIQQQRELINQLDLRIGLLQVGQNKVDEALKTWAGVGDRAISETSPSAKIATVLLDLWQSPPRLLPDAQPLIQKQLEGWFRYKALTRLYQLQQRSDALASLDAAQQQIARDTLVKLIVVGTLPTIAGVVGFILLIMLLGQWLVRGKQSLLAEKSDLAWQVPWDGETIWVVLILGFFFLGQIVIPVLTSVVGGSLAAFGSRAKAIYTLTYYLLLAGSGLLVLYLAVKPFFPLPEGWFRLTNKRNWLLWGVGGYLVALPLMLGVSLVNQQIWQGQGGSNPLLQIVLEEGDAIALTIFFLTAAVAAPLFEETLFRGFLLPSLTRYLPTWGAIALSGLIFAVAHLSLGEVLPLFVLGCILGVVYTRTRALLAPMLLHSLWNSVTMIGLFILGSAAK